MTWCDPRGSRGRAPTGVVALAVLLAGVAAVALGCTGSSQPRAGAKPAQSGAKPAASPASFVTRSGASLMLNGRPFRFSGANIYWGGLDDAGRAGLNYPTPFRVDSALQTAVDMGETVVRCQTCGISTGTPMSVAPGPGGVNQTALRHIDYFIAQAQRYGLKVVIPLTDNYNYYLGSYCDFTNWLGLSAPSDCPSPAAATAFYTSPAAIAAFEQYIALLLNHVNDYTGVPNKDNPAIMAWETGNEMPYGLGGPPEFTKWTATISAYIKSQAPSQLVMDGALSLDPGDLTLPDVDAVDMHFYPASPAALTTDALQAAAAGMPLVAGEYAWNDAPDLHSFLSDIQQTPDVAGDLYWDLQPQNDLFGYVENLDGYQLHFPGDNMDVSDNGGEPVLARAPDTGDVTELRNHAYAMSGRPVPAYLVPAAPVVTNVEHVASETAGAGNLLEWRGSAGAASYLVQRSTAGPDGPWDTVATVSAAGTEAPWLDRGAGPGPDLWYRVTAVNPDGASGPPSAAYQLTTRTLDDNLNDFSAAASHDPGVTLDTSNPWRWAGDASRAAFWPSPADEAVAWRVPELLDFEAVAYYASPAATYFTFQVSANGTAWTRVPASEVQANQLVGTTPLEQASYVYTIDNVQRMFPGARYVRVERPGGATGVAELGEVRITYP